MCIAILNLTAPLPEQQLLNSATANPDGFGLLFAHNEQLKVYKTLDLNNFISAYYELRDAITTPIVLHFRWTTHGETNIENCHPFVINKNLGFVHNGIIPNYGNKKQSDTFCYNEQVLKRLQNNFLRSRQIKEKIVNEIGYSKLVFLDNFSNYHIINEHYGHWRDDNWYSNDSYQSYDDFDSSFDDGYFFSFYGEDLPPYYDKLNADEKCYLFDLIDNDYPTPPDLDSFLFDYQIYSAIIAENEKVEF